VKPLPRGKKGKIKKIREKYADQDDEEREIRMALLASAKKVQEGPKEKQKKGKTQSQKSAASTNTNTSTSTKNKNESEQTEKGDKLNRKSRAEKREARIEAEREIQSIMEEENITEDILQDNVDLIDSLTGNPLSQDVLLFAVPVCAPISSTQNYKYKIKLTPGNLRKGKACKAAISSFLHSTVGRERDVIKSIPENEILLTFMPDVHLHLTHSITNKKKSHKQAVE